ncbi:hypothetical protein L204_102524 [Cryptococcus depauperatus]
MTQITDIHPQKDVKDQSLQTRSLLPILLNADPIPKPISQPYPTVHPVTKLRLVPFHLTLDDFHVGLPPMGLITQEVLECLKGEEGIQFYSESKEVTRKENKRKGEKDKVTKTYNFRVACVYFSDEVNEKGKEGRTEVIRGIMEKWRKEGKFAKAMLHWMNEPFPIHASPNSKAFKSKVAARALFGNIAFDIERAGVPLFGFQAFGCHLTAYEGEGEHMKLWIPRRSTNMWRFPLKFDSSVAGGLPANHTPMEGLIKECEEEAGWPEKMIRKYVKSVGMVTYFEMKEDGAILPNTEYTYDLPMPPRSSPDYVVPKPNDNEVDSFELYPVQEVIEALHDNEFKPSSAVATIDFLVRHGYINADNEPNFGEVVRRLHRWLGVAGPGL